MVNSDLKKKKRIFLPFLGGGLVPGIGGGTIRIYELLRAVVKSGFFEIHIAITEPGLESLKKYFTNSLEIIKEIMFYPLKASLFLKKEPFRLHQVWATFLSMIHLRLLFGKLPDFDIGYAPSPFFYNILPLIKLLKKGKIKKIFSSIYHQIPKPSERKGARVLNYLMYKQDRWMYSLLRKYAFGLVISDSLEGYIIADKFTRKGFSKENIVFSKMGVHIKEIDKISISQKKFDAIHIGMRPNKGIFDLPEIWHEVVKDCPNAKLALIGNASPSVKQNLLNEFFKVGIQGSVQFLGFVSEEEKYAFLKSSRIFIAPSHEEGWGIAVGEALASEIPVVAYDLPVYQHIYTDCYVSVPCYDKQVFGQKIKEVLRQTEAYADLIHKSKKRMERLDWDCLFEDEINLFLK